MSLLGPGAAGVGLQLGPVAGSRQGADASAWSGPGPAAGAGHVAVDARPRASSFHICARAEPANETPLLGVRQG